MLFLLQPWVDRTNQGGHGCSCCVLGIEILEDAQSDLCPFPASPLLLILQDVRHLLCGMAFAYELLERRIMLRQ